MAPVVGYESFLRGPTNSLSFGNPGGAPTNRPDGMCFDANGNLLAETSSPCPPAVPTYTYDAENRLVNYMGGSAAYTYDGNGLRVKKVSGGTTTVYIFSGGKDIAEYDNGVAPASPSREYIYSGAQLLATITGSGATATTTYHHADHLSVRVSTDGTTGSPTLGQKIGEQGHFPFGEAWFTSNTTTKFFFTTYERDSESGLDYALARFYISRFGRFCSADPVEGWPADPQSWNRYAYVRNDPVNLTDPSGQFWGFLIHLFVALFHAIFHALGFLGAHLGHAFGVLGQAQVGTELIQGGLMTSPTGPVISATVWTAEIPIYATSINWAAIAGYAGIGAAAAGGNGVGFLRDASKGLQTKIRRPKDCIYESICF